MLILALDTTTRAGSVAILRGTDVLYEQAGDATVTHAQRLPTELMRACEGAGVRPADLELLAVAVGPGSFTGLRIGIATVQGLGMALDRRIVPVSTLEAIAVAAPSAQARVAAWLDAYRGEVFAQVFDRSGDHEAHPLTEAAALTPDEALRQQAPWLGGAVFHGDGALRYQATILEGQGRDAKVAERIAPLAAAIGRIAGRHAERAVLPHAVVPIYVRRPDVEVVRDRRSGA